MFGVGENMSQKEKLVVEAIRSGTVIDHIPSERTLQVVELLAGPEDCYFMGVNLHSTSVGKKGIVKMVNRRLNEKDLEILSALAPEATVNVIEDFDIVEKKHLAVPEEVVGLFVCPNTRCITNHEPIVTRFRLGKSVHTCRYCERSFVVHRLRPRRRDEHLVE
jgi:aspartate carbamoyltransferase regulatory subunit